MAFGIEAGGKLFLSLFRIVAVVLIILYIRRLVKESYKTGFIVCVTLVLAGARGISSTASSMVLFSKQFSGTCGFSGGHGVKVIRRSFMVRVVDMLYFPLFSGTWP